MDRRDFFHVIWKLLKETLAFSLLLNVSLVVVSRHIIYHLRFTLVIRLKKARKPHQPRLRFDLEKLRDPVVACTSGKRITESKNPFLNLNLDGVSL